MQTILPLSGGKTALFCAFYGLFTYPSSAVPQASSNRGMVNAALAGLVEGNTTASNPVRGWAYLRYSLPLVAPLQKMACTPRRFTRAARSFGSTSLMEASDAPRMEQAWMTSHTASPLPMMMARLASRSSHAGVGLWVRVAISGQNRFCGWP